MSDDQPSDEMSERGPRDSRRVWLAMEADRRAVTGGLLTVVFVSLVTAGTLLPWSAYSLLTAGDPHETLFNALVGATITGVTLVLTLSQLVLSQELGSVGDQRDRMEGAVSFRSDVADAIGVDVAPTEPSAFLRTLVVDTRERAEQLRDAAPDGDAGDAVETYTDNLVQNADRVVAQLRGTEFGTFDVLRAALNYNYSWKIYAGERLRADHGDALSERANGTLDDLLETLRLFGPAREHFKTLYFQWELSELSRTLLYAAVPALVVSIAALLLFNPAQYPGTTLGVNHALLVVSAAATVASLPFLVLLSYIVRIVTVTKRTLSIGAFVLRETDHATDSELARDYSE
ncbi:hypothetical protein [Halobacterium jilantaiense]|uniref:Uncharacterized protein n=1 Tax=Halobacterium jilantaiense TaxID=355548 RepID=A0A1I0QGW6_9EURY|nr:hypothetical protein [Halobacterium jilantaiense]SEW26300.1 hypothetical protein SAMN04487945_2601 [Halobacterium jilantaiense]